MWQISQCPSFGLYFISAIAFKLSVVMRGICLQALEYQCGKITIHQIGKKEATQLKTEPNFRIAIDSLTSGSLPGGLSVFIRDPYSGL